MAHGKGKEASKKQCRRNRAERKCEKDAQESSTPDTGFLCTNLQGVSKKPDTSRIDLNDI